VLLHNNRQTNAQTQEASSMLACYWQPNVIKPCRLMHEKTR